jgi:hypothetical protein
VLQWVWGHCGVKGNEVAYRVANMGHLNAPISFETIKLERVPHCPQRQTTRALDKNMEGFCCSQMGAFLSNIMNEPILQPWLSLKSCRLKCAAAWLRIGHTGVRSCLHRFNMNDSESLINVLHATLWILLSTTCCIASVMHSRDKSWRLI